VVCAAAALPPGERIVVELGGRSIGVFNIDGRLYAVRNTCPHQGAPLCEGAVSGTMTSSRPHSYEYDAERLVVACPWHGWEFELESGRSVFDPTGTRVRCYAAHVVGDDIVVEL
jgi:3-phenylpropionate/trans-cinnamate dioxygenase ferredoxin subunit